jgi:hypothetical protein
MLAIIQCRIFCLLVCYLKIKKNKIYRTIILPALLNVCETWLLILREECRLREFENTVLRRIFGPKRDGVSGEWEKFITRSLTPCTPHQVLCG